jgi:hypothetical protein
MSEEDTPVANDQKGGQGDTLTEKKKKHHQGHEDSQAATPTPPEEGPAGGSVDGKQQRKAKGKAPERKWVTSSK